MVLVDPFGELLLARIEFGGVLRHRRRRVARVELLGSLGQQFADARLRLGVEVDAELVEHGLEAFEEFRVFATEDLANLVEVRLRGRDRLGELLAGRGVGVGDRLLASAAAFAIVSEASLTARWVASAALMVESVALSPTSFSICSSRRASWAWPVADRAWAPIFIASLTNSLRSAASGIGSHRRRVRARRWSSVALPGRRPCLGR